MFFTTDLLSAVVATLLLSGSASAAPRLEIDYRSEAVADMPEDATMLDPVLPPEVNPRDLSILNLDKTVTLAWAGVVEGSDTGHKMKRDQTVFSQATFDFNYPAVPLDHSDFVKSVSCDGGALTAKLSTVAYDYVKDEWKGQKKMLFITAVEGCGDALDNDLFLSSSFTFNDDEKSFTAKGSETTYKDISSHFNLKWGKPGSSNLKRNADKRWVFDDEPAALARRDTADPYANGWGVYLHTVLGTDYDAPWEKAAHLFTWSKEGKEEDDSWKKGETAKDGRNRRSVLSGDTSLVERAFTLDERGLAWSLAERELDYGLKLYCVDCGFVGDAEFYSEIDTSFPYTSLDTFEFGFNAKFKASMNLGLQAYVKYEKEWKKSLGEVDLGSWGIPFVCTIGPYIEVGISAKAGIEASGALLVGTTVEWPNINFHVDVLDPGRSGASGFTPQFTPRAEASGELKAEAGVGLPIDVGLKLEMLLGLITAKAAIRDTPSINIEGKFEVSAKLEDTGEIKGDINGGCYGVAWSVFFKNEVDAIASIDYTFDDDEWTRSLIKPFKGDPIFQGCIGYVNDGTHDNEMNGEGTGNAAGNTGNGMQSNANGLAGQGSNKGSSGGSKPQAQGASESEPKSEPENKQTGSQETVKEEEGSKKGDDAPAVVVPVPAATKKPTTPTKKPAVPACTPGKTITNPKTPKGLTCKKQFAKANVATKYNLGKATAVKDTSACATRCLKDKKCSSFAFNAGKKTCQLYNVAYKKLGVSAKNGLSTLTMFDKSCYALSTCPK